MLLRDLVVTPTAHDVARRYESGGPLPRPPLCSFGHGAAGVAYYLLRYGQLTGNTGSLRRAAEWIAQTEHCLADPGALTGDAPVFPDDRAAIPAALYFGEAGTWCCGALVATALEDQTGVERSVERFTTLAETCPVDRPDVVSGAAGLLLGTAAMVERLGPDDRLVAVGGRLNHRLTRIAGAGVERAADALGWLGAAHGWSGIAHALLRWSQATGNVPAPEVVGLLALLRESRASTGLWPRHTGSPEVWPGWCHGSAGWVQLWTLVGEVTDDEDSLELAEVAAADAVAIEDAGAGLCCGDAGSAYAALAMHRATGDGTWLAHAHRLAARAERATPGPAFPEHSLWQGDLGVALLLAELEDPSTAAMPLYRRH